MSLLSNASYPDCTTGREDFPLKRKSLDEIRSDLNLIMEIPHTGISVSWELDNYEVMNSRGVLKQEKLTEEGTLVKLTAVLRYDEEKMSCEFYAHLFSTPLSKKEGVLKKISQEVAGSAGVFLVSSGDSFIWFSVWLPVDRGKIAGCARRPAGRVRPGLEPRNVRRPGGPFRLRSC